MRAVTFFDGELREGTLIVEHPEPGASGVRLLAQPPPPGTPRLDGDDGRTDSVVTGRFTDHHTHLQLVDSAALPSSRLGRVVDLGGTSSVIAELAETLAHDEPSVTTVWAGPFLTAPGGYPSDRSWAASGAVAEIADAEQATQAVRAAAAGGATLIKVVAHSLAGPTLSDELFTAIVRAAHQHRLAVVAHAEGPGQATRAVRLGAALLAHAPFSERLSSSELRMHAASAAWISTLAIHDDADRATAIDNIRRFRSLGGDVLYGTDMGNGEGVVDVREPEIVALREAGVTGIDLLTALSPASPVTPGEPLLLTPLDNPAAARRLTADDAAADNTAP
ncbi:hydrolase [Microbacterium sp. YY-01]|uniref:hydrolase n=1 Tax=Microbacterium sp. YY-01 TaxID=3421634 RepID=UPI003D185D2A